MSGRVIFTLARRIIMLLSELVSLVLLDEKGGLILMSNL